MERRERAHGQMFKQRARELAQHQFWQVGVDGKCQLPAPPHHAGYSQNLPPKATLCDPPEHQRLCGAEQALLARLSVRVLAPKGTSYFHVMDVQGNVFACREGPRLAGWGGEQGLAGEVGGGMLGDGAGEGETLPGNGLSWTRAAFGSEAGVWVCWCVRTSGWGLC